jgi:two-component system nitrate/nitrite response regulator NarL
MPAMVWRPQFHKIELIKQGRPTARMAVLASSNQIRDLVSVVRAATHACSPRKATPGVPLKSLVLMRIGETLLPQTTLPLILRGEEQASHEAQRRLDDELPTDRTWSLGNDPLPKFNVDDNAKCVENNRPLLFDP